MLFRPELPPIRFRRPTRNAFSRHQSDRKLVKLIRRERRSAEFQAALHPQWNVFEVKFLYKKIILLAIYVNQHLRSQSIYCFSTHQQNRKLLGKSIFSLIEKRTQE